jgi:hypothetical protein
MVNCSGEGVGMHFKMIVVAELLLVAQPLLATKWVPVGATIDSRTFIDLDSIDRKGGNIVNVWVKLEYDPPKIDAVSGRYYWSMDCANRLSKTINGTLYDKNNSLVYTLEKSSKYENVIPESNADTVLLMVCPKRK